MNRSPRLAVLPLLLVLVAAKSPLERRVTVEVSQAPLTTFLDTVSAQAKVNFVLTEGFEDRKVTAFLHNVTIKEALKALLEIKGLDYYQLAEGTYLVAKKGDRRLAPAVIGGGPELEQKVTVDVKNAPLDKLVATISAQTKINFVLAEGLEKRRVTAVLKNVKVREALSIMLAIKGLNCRKSADNTYVIAP